jgi:hypothetical protein
MYNYGNAQRLKDNAINNLRTWSSLMLGKKT